MAEFSMPFDAKMLPGGTFDREYNAAQWIKYFQPLVSTGVVQPGLSITATGGMITTMIPGMAYVLNRYYENDANKLFTHEVETAGMERIDRIVLKLDVSLATREITSYVKKGTPAVTASVVPPTLTRSGDIYEISLAKVRVIGGATSVTVGNVTDERPDVTVCGWADSKILPSYNESVLQTHIKNNDVHVKYAIGTVSGANINVTLPDITSYVDGTAIAIKMDSSGLPSNNMNIKVGSLAAIPLKTMSGDNVPGGTWVTNAVITVRYSAGSFILQGEGGGKLKTYTNNNVPLTANSNIELYSNQGINVGFKIKGYVINIENIKITKVINGQSVSVYFGLTIYNVPGIDGNIIKDKNELNDIKMFQTIDTYGGIKTGISADNPNVISLRLSIQRMQSDISFVGNGTMSVMVYG